MYLVRDNTARAQVSTPWRENVRPHVCPHQCLSPAPAPALLGTGSLHVLLLQPHALWPPETSRLQHPLSGLCRETQSHHAQPRLNAFSAAPTGTLPVSPPLVPSSPPQGLAMPLASQSLENVCFMAFFAAALALQNCQHLSVYIINSPPISNSIESTFSPLLVVPKLYTQLISKYQFRNLAR